MTPTTSLLLILDLLVLRLVRLFQYRRMLRIRNRS
jgi:hypothetical protein